MREIITDWTTPGTAAGATVMYWRETPPTAFDQREALEAFWLALNPRLGSSVTWTIRTSGRHIDEETGTLTGAWTDATARTASGTGGTLVVADATQALVRWNTTTIYEGRFIRGRTFVPGLNTASVIDGNLGPVSLAAFQTAADDLILSGTGLGVWSRPKPGIPGLWAGVGSAGVWPELAVLRKRRG